MASYIILEYNPKGIQDLFHTHVHSDTIKNIQFIESI